MDSDYIGKFNLCIIKRTLTLIYDDTRLLVKEKPLRHRGIRLCLGGF